MSHRALVVSSIAKSVESGIKNLTVQQQESRALKPREVRIRIRAASLNYFDLLQLVGKYQMKPPLPFVPGAEAAGDVIEIGSSVKTVKVGDKVIVAMAQGMLAEQAVVLENQLIPMPRNLSYSEASGFGVGYFTAYHGLVHRGNLTKGDVLLVTGAAGGMGIAAIQVAKALGATVIASASSQEKLNACTRAGADHVVDYSKQDLKTEVEKLTKGKLANVVYENVGGEVAMQALRCVASQGRFLVIGFASGTIPSIPANIPLIKGFSVVGVRSGAEMLLNPKMTQEMIVALLGLADQGKLKPLIYCEVPLSKAQDAFFAIANRNVIGKAVVLLDTENQPKL